LILRYLVGTERSAFSEHSAKFAESAAAQRCHAGDAERSGIPRGVETLILRHDALALDATPAEVMTPEVMGTLFGFTAAMVTSGGRAWVVPTV
jgi:hypothetical protein